MQYNSKMVSFTRLGEYGRFGNQLFQYAYIRTQAKRLGTRFYCPYWIGDKVFNLYDDKEKGNLFIPEFLYEEGDFKHGFQIEAIKIKDGTDVRGYFQSANFFSSEDIQKWYSFNESLFESVKKKYEYIDFSDATAIHMRLGDYNKLSTQFYVVKKSYFKKALKVVGPRKNILVFSDEPILAKKYLGNLSSGVIFIQGNTDYEDFYLMTTCKNIVCSASSFSWWAAYLNKYSDKKVVVPTRWFLPGSKTKNDDIYVHDWIKIRAHRWYDHRLVKALLVRLQKLF